MKRKILCGLVICFMQVLSFASARDIQNKLKEYIKEITDGVGSEEKKTKKTGRLKKISTDLQEIANQINPTQEKHKDAKNSSLDTGVNCTEVKNIRKDHAVRLHELLTKEYVETNKKKNQENNNENERKIKNNSNNVTEGILPYMTSLNEVD